MIKDQIIEYAGQRWLVHQAISLNAAQSEIDHARATGSVGSRTTRTLENGWEQVVAHVNRVNSDGTEQQPYTTLY